MDPKFSIIIPLYNKEKYIKSTLASISEQSFKDFEAIIIDDGSTDKSPEIAASFCQGKDNFIYIKKENTGVIETRNFGFKLAKGQLILPFDADDVMLPNFLRDINQAAESNKSCDVFSPSVEHNGKIRSHRKINTARILFRNEIPANTAFRKICLQSVKGYNQNMKDGFEDYDFWIYFLENNHRFMRVKKSKYIYTQTDSSRNQEALPRRSKLLRQIYENHQRTYDSYRYLEKLSFALPFLHFLKKMGITTLTYDAIIFFNTIKKESI